MSECECSERGLTSAKPYFYYCIRNIVRATKERKDERDSTSFCLLGVCVFFVLGYLFQSDV